MENGDRGFFELNKNLKEYSGDIFERLVEIILKKLYPQYNFMRTEYSHDGGKDFYAVDGEINIWAEAKCHKRHLELGRIAGTFIMAELCKINRIIVFSLSRLTCGAVKYLTRFTSQKGKELIIFSDSDIHTLIRSFGTIENEEILSSISKAFDLNEDIATLVKNVNFNEIVRRLTQLKANKDEDEERRKDKLNLYLTIYAYLTFNEFAQGNDSTGMSFANVKILDRQFYLQNGNDISKTLKTEIKAFEIFTAELIIRNEDVLCSKNLKIKFEKLTSHYSAITPAEFEGNLLPGQSIALTFYFKALNTSCNLKLPQPSVFVEDNLIECAMTHNDISIIPCRVIGEVPYFGADSNKLSQLNQDLGKEKYFTTVLVYGKSGVGKSRFLYELQTACLKKGKRCFIFHGDTVNNSVLDFIRQLLYGYYNISFVGNESEITLPENLLNLSNDLKIRKNIEFINSCINSRDASKINFTLARNWLDDILSAENTTLIIDNAQCLDKEVLNLLGKIISDLKNCRCNSEIIITFNTDLLISGSPADNFFKHLRCTVRDEFKVCLQGFDDCSAIDYLKYSLDPLEERKDLWELYKAVVKRANNNPLFLKQTVLYLHQLKIIGFQNDAICILNHARLVAELNGLPDTVFDIIKARYNLLITNVNALKPQIKDLFWSILIFGEFPEKFIYYIKNFNMNALNICIELGFLKYGTYNTLVFEHQLIEKSVLLLLENKSYNSHPSIVNIDLSVATANSFIKNIQSKIYATTLFALKDKCVDISPKDFNNFLPEISLDNITELFIPYIVDMVSKLIHRYNADIQAELKTEALYLLIRNSQDRLGVQKTAQLFRDAIEFQSDNYNLNAACAEEFIELLKYYLYELPQSEKDNFLNKMKKIGLDLLSEQPDNNLKDDFEVWILWAFGKNAMHMYKFAEAKSIFNSAVAFAKSKENHHRLAELEIQLGFLYSYLEDKKQTKAHWNEACLNFSGLNFYEIVLNYVYEGNVGLLNGDFSKSKAMCVELEKIYESKDSYDFLKSVSNDFISNSLILEFVTKGEYSIEKINIIITVLERFRALTLMYDTNAYLHAAYKSLAFYSYIVENFSPYICENDLIKYKRLIFILAEELLYNYDWNSQNFEFFYPVFKDIAYAVGKDNIWRDYFTNIIPQNRRELFSSLCMRIDKIAEYGLNERKGIFNDAKNIVNLFHYTYRW